VRYILHDRKPDAKLYDNLDFDLLVKLWRSGMNFQEIAIKLNTTRSRVEYKFKKKGLI
jgi:hypothetical protein